MRLCRRLTGMLLVVVMLLSMIPVAFADGASKYPDFPTGWSKEAMTAAVNNGLLNGYEDGKIYPEANLTRAEFAAIITRAFGAKTKADVSAYTDVVASEWYYDAIARAVKMGALNGKSESKMDPDAPITRQETFTAVARIFVLSDSNTSILKKFNDNGKIASWAAEYMAALTKRGYVNGDHEGNCNPESYISREEFAQFMHNAIRTYITEPGTYTDDLEGITVVRVGDVFLKDLKITSDLIIGDGVDKDRITISGVTIEKRLLARGGTIKVSNSKRGDFVVVNNVNGTTYFKNYRNEAFFKGIVENTKAQFLTYSSGGGINTSDTVTVTFYDGYNSDDKLKTLTIKKGTTVKLEEFPTAEEHTGYIKDASVAPVYQGSEPHKIKSDFWYVKDGVMTHFDETVVVNENTSVYMLTKSLGLMLAYEDGSTELAVLLDAYYNKDTRIADSVKDIIADSLKRQLALLPPDKLAKIEAKVFGTMESAGVIDENKNIKIINIPFKISDFVKDSIKQNDYYRPFVDLLSADNVEINKSNIQIFKDIRNSGIGHRDDLSFLYEEMLDDYLSDLDKVIYNVESSLDPNCTEYYTTSLSLRLNILDVYKELHKKVAPKVIEKLENANINYAQNDYLKFLIDEDENFLSYLVDGDGIETGDFTGYRLKGVMDYYNFLSMLLIVGDDALTYADNQNLTEEQFEALYDAMFDKIFAVYEKLNDILIAVKEDGTLPSQIQNAIESVEKINGLMVNYEDKLRAFIEKYLGSSINFKFDDESIATEEKVVKFIDFLAGKDDPRVNIDSVYLTIDEYEENIQAKLKQLIENDKFKQAIEKFATTPFGEILGGKDSLDDFFYTLANEGMDAFKVPAAEMKVTDIDRYEIPIGKVKITVKRVYK